MLSDLDKALIRRVWPVWGPDAFLDHEQLEQLAPLIDAARQEGRQSSGERVKALEDELRRLTSLPSVIADELAGSRDAMGSAADLLEHAGKREWADRLRRQTDRNRAALLSIGRDVERVRALLSPQAAPVEQGGEADEDLGCDYCRSGDQIPAGSDYWKCPRCDGEWWPNDLPANEQKDGAS